MNCKPDQLAWIAVPAAYIGTGLEEIDGHVVRTVRLLDGMKEIVWEVKPPQSATFLRPLVDNDGQELNAGERGTADGIPDSWLRPFDPRSAPRESIKVLELLA